jgi:hypothetical protein
MTNAFGLQDEFYTDSCLLRFMLIGNPMQGKSKCIAYKVQDVGSYDQQTHVTCIMFYNFYFLNKLYTKNDTWSHMTFNINDLIYLIG